MSKSTPSVDPRLDDWRRRVESELSGEPLDQLSSEPVDGLVLPPLFTEAAPDDARFRPTRSPIDNALGWHLCSRCEVSSVDEARRQCAADLDGGATALWLRLDRSVRLGVSPDRSAGDGIATQSADDLDRLLDGVSLTALPVLLDAGANALPAALALLAVADRRGDDRSELEWHFNLDPLAQLASDGALPAALDSLAVEMRQLTTFCDAVLPRSTAIAASGLPYQQAGADPTQELGIVCATVIEYLRWLEREGVEPAVAAPSFILRLAIDGDLFGSIAKLRALRLLWHKILGALDIDAAAAQGIAASVHAVGSDRSLTVRDPWVNALRASGQAVAGVLGGADLLTVPSYDRTLGSPSAAGRRLARNTQSILGEECALGRVADPAGGSYYLERLTDEYARRAWQAMQSIERQGGLSVALASGWVHERLASAWARRTSAIAHRTAPITGVTAYANLEERPPERAEAAPVAAEARTDGPRALPDLELAAALDRLAVWSRCAGDGATVSAISAALDRDPGPRIEPLPRHRDAEVFEALRDAAEAAQPRPTVHLELLGSTREHKARASFAQDFFAAGGIAIAPPGAFDSSGAAIACLCGTDEAYTADGTSRARALRTAGATTVLIAGRAEVLSEPDAVDGALHVGCDALALLGGLLR